ncbi:hypothetical protein J5N97_023313 [Dioscorea zingiberensis]|uniref:Uncharacterized protein n=1 Tax=Dioscorea zingiberensis TaxID=325984 RepID=A0A9D5CC66_9LILI|nr:hypothetical protein J5N97_023313 [Dioscorea zingiberensis]
MSQSTWEADKMLDVYIYDYFLKRNLQSAAKAFKADAKVAVDPVAIDAPGGFLLEWWSVFWDIFIARTNEKHSEVAAAYIEAQQLKAKELQMQQLLHQRRAQMQQRDSNHPSLNGPMNAVGSDGILGPATASMLAAKLYQEQMKHPHGLDSEASSQLLDPGRIATLKSAVNHSGQLIHGNAGSMSAAAALQQMQARTQQAADIKGEMGVVQRSLPMDTSSMFGQRIIQSKSGLGSAAGLNQGVSALKGYPLSDVDQIHSNLGPQMHRPFIPTQNQFQLLSPQQQNQLLPQAQVPSNLGHSSNYGDVDPQRLRGLLRANLTAKEGQQAMNDGSVTSVGSPIQSNSPNLRLDPSEYLIKMKATNMQQSLVHPQQEQMQPQQQLQQNNRKRKQSSSGAANSTGTGNTVGPSNSPPSTPSIHTPGDGMGMGGNLQHVNMSKNLMMYGAGADGTGVLASSSNQMGDLDHFADVGSLDDNVESFLSHDDADARDIFSALKTSPAEHKSELSKSFTFTEAGCTRASSDKIVCCHFSSDGKLLASAGHEKKVFLWNMDTKKTEITPEEHSLLITDVRFRPNSTYLATSSLDKTVRLWNAAEPNYCLHTYTGHSAEVTSLDFHPKKTDLLCSCDGNGEIRFWNVGQYSCSRVSKCGATQVRFQPRIGHHLAAPVENTVSIFDVETDRKTMSLQGHNKVHSVCWDANGDYLASVSQDYVKVWSLSAGNCIHELSSSGNKFHSCVFHPTYTTLLIIGGYQSLSIWSMVDNQLMMVQAHDGLIAGLTQSPLTGLVASASHDKTVKLWK